MTTLHFEIEIKAPAEKIYRTMLGLDDIGTYEQWTALFNPGSTYRGTWEKGTRIHFVGYDDKGNMGGMVSEIADHIPSRFVSIRHLGLLSGESELFDGPEVEKWAGGTENYTFRENDGVTTVQVDTDSTEDFVGYFNEAWPKALEKLEDLVTTI